MIFGFGIWKLDDFGGTYDIGVSWCTIVPLRCCIPLCSCSILFLLIPPYFVDWSKWSSSSRLRHALFLRFPMTSGFWPIWPCLPYHLRSQSRSPFFGIGGLNFSMITWVWAWMHSIQWTRTHFFSCAWTWFVSKDSCWSFRVQWLLLAQVQSLKRWEGVVLLRSGLLVSNRVQSDWLWGASMSYGLRFEPCLNRSLLRWGECSGF